MTVAAAAQGTAISVAMDMTEGIIARFRTMAISRASVLTGHVVGSLIQTMLSLAVVIGVALLIGFRPDRRPRSSGSAAVGLLALLALALTWLSVALGLVSKSVEAASNLADAADAAAVPRQRLRPDRLDAGRAALVRRVPAVHADHRDPARPAAGHRRSATAASLAVAWCVGIALVGYLWAKRLFNRDPTP